MEKIYGAERGHLKAIHFVMSWFRAKFAESENFDVIEKFDVIILKSLI